MHDMRSRQRYVDIVSNIILTEQANIDLSFVTCWVKKNEIFRQNRTAVDTEFHNNCSILRSLELSFAVTLTHRTCHHFVTLSESGASKTLNYPQLLRPTWTHWKTSLNLHRAAVSWSSVQWGSDLTRLLSSGHARSKGKGSDVLVGSGLQWAAGGLGLHRGRELLWEIPRRWSGLHTHHQ